MYDFYLAAPFFNDQQIELVKRIETIAASLFLRCFSPRLEGPSLKPGASQNDRAHVANVNQRGIQQSEFVLAVLDYLLPADQSLMVVKHPDLDLLHIRPVMPVNIPDTGTVWEMGKASGMEKAVIGFKLEAKGVMNVMLAQTCAGMLYGLDELAEFLHVVHKEDLYAALKLLKPWQGAVR